MSNTTPSQDKSDQVVLTFSADHKLATIALGTPDQRAIVLTPNRLESFKQALTQVRSSSATGLVIHSPNPDSFCVGADITVIESVTDPKVGAELAQQGQEIYDLLEDLKCTTVAAIGGPCVGGGCEMVLACDYRVISDSKASAIGLPETKLGILPGFGGTYRLPRLVGLPKALDIILAGKTLRAPQALKAGLVDSVVAPNELLTTAERIARGEHKPKRVRPRFIDRLLSSNPVGRAIVRSQARRALLKQTKGFYPAPVSALDATVWGLGQSRKRALTNEARELGALITSPQSKALVHLYFLTETAKGLGKTARREIARMHTLVIGAGTMGAGIAGTLAKNDHQVIVKDTSEAALERGKQHTAKEIAKNRHLSSFERAAVLNKIDWATSPTPTMARSGIVIEAVFEDMELKKGLFREIAPRVNSSTILATNTSSLSVSEMAKDVDHPERFVGMHFFNPVEKMPLVEIIRGERTDEATIAKVAALATEIGKFPIVVQDVPGFLINRILIPYLNEAIFLLLEGHSIEAIDDAALSFGMPMGPIRLLDEIGLDVAAHVSKVMVAGYGERMAAPNIAEKMVALDRKGRKNSRGFYNYNGRESTSWSGLSQALGLPSSPRDSLSRDELTQRLIYHLVNEALKCLDEGVAGDDREIAKQQIDLGTVMGIGFPPFRGGVIYYAEREGLDRIHERLSQFEVRYGERYRAVGVGMRRKTPNG